MWVKIAVGFGLFSFLVTLHIAIAKRDTPYHYFGQVLCEIARKSDTNRLSQRLYSGAFVILAITHCILYGLTGLPLGGSSITLQIRGTLVIGGLCFGGMGLYHVESQKALHGFFLVSAAICRTIGHSILANIWNFAIFTYVCWGSGLTLIAMLMGAFVIRPYKWRGKTVLATSQKIFCWLEGIKDLLVFFFFL